MVHAWMETTADLLFWSEVTLGVFFLFSGLDERFDFDSMFSHEQEPSQNQSTQDP